MKFGIATLLFMVFAAFTILIHHELTESRFYAFSIGCEDYLSGEVCHKLAEKYINDNPTWGVKE